MDWPGWEQDVLKAGGWPVTPENVRFLEEWHPYEESKCNANPLNTTLPLKGSTDCVHVSGSTWVQAYVSDAQGATATARTIKGPFYPNLGPALATGDPYSYPSTQGVAQDIRTWGTPRYADFYLTQVSGSAKSGATTTTTPEAVAPSGHAGWTDLRNTVNRHLPTQLSRSQALRLAALRTLGSHSRVGR